jgi:hypothetical protein
VSEGEPLRPQTEEELRLRVDRSKEFVSSQEPLIHDQHVVSAVLLREFAAAGAWQGLKVLEVDLKYHPKPGKPRYRSPREAGKVTDFVLSASDSAERLWKNVEDNLPSALRAAQTDQILDDERSLSVIREAMALHYVRSIQVWRVHQRSWNQARNNVRSDLTANPETLRRVFIDRFGGIEPAGNEAIDPDRRPVQFIDRAL